jgi:hypothetical protein
MSESQARKTWSTESFIALAVFGAQCLAVLHPDAIPLDQEELYNAAHGRLLQLGHWPDLLTLQYRGYCGGCSINAAMGAGFFGLFGHSLVAWKLVPITYSAILAFVGSRILRVHVGLPAAIAFGLILIFPPPTYMELSLTAWGNHMESGVFAVVVLSSVLRLLHKPSHLQAVVVGLLLAFSLWIGFSSGFIAIGTAACLLWARLPRHLATVFITGSSVAAVWILQAELSPSSAFETIYYSGESIPSISRIPAKLWSLIAPRQIVALFGLKLAPWGWVLGWASALSALIASFHAYRRPDLRPVFIFLAAFLSVYSLVRFTVWTPPSPEISPPGSMRYAAPMYGLIFLLHAGGAGLLWVDGRRLMGSLLLLAPLAVGWQTKSVFLEAPFPDKSVFSMAAPNLTYARDQISYLLTLEQHQDCDSSAEDTVSLHAFGIGWQETRKLLDSNSKGEVVSSSSPHPAALEGISAALLLEIDSDERGGLRTLVLMNQRLETFSTPDRETILASATWRRIVPWTHTLAEHGQGRMGDWAGRMNSLPQVAQVAATRAFGRSWAHDTARFRRPTAFAVPDISPLDPSLQNAFIEGLAEGIGEMWGHGNHPIEQLPATFKEVWTRGQERGIDRWWLTPTRLFPEYRVRR